MPQHGTKRGERLSKSPGLTRRFTALLTSLSIVLVGAAALLVAFVLPGSRTRHGPEQALAVGVTDGEVHLPVSQVRGEGGRAMFFALRDGPSGGTRFFVIEDPPNHFRVALDDCGNCKVKRGYRQEEKTVVCNYCDRRFPIESLRERQDRCAPIPLRSRIESDHLVVVFGD